MAKSSIPQLSLLEESACLHLAMRWEEILRSIGQRTRLTHGTNLSKNRTAFLRLHTYLISVDMDPEDYFAALVALMRNSKKKWTPWVAQFGTAFLNKEVEAFLAHKQERLTQQPQHQSYDHIPQPRKRLRISRANLQAETQRYHQYLAQYGAMSPGMFWLHFVDHFTGIFLAVCPTFQDILEEIPLTEEQRQDMADLTAHPDLWSIAQEHYKTAWASLMERYDHDYSSSADQWPLPPFLSILQWHRQHLPLQERVSAEAAGVSAQGQECAPQ